MIEVESLTKSFGDFVALRDVSLQVRKGELMALLGPSGSGKTTLLRIIAGLEFPDCGRVCFEGRETTHLSTRDRRVGFVFQHFALFRHMTVFGNVAFGLEVRKHPHRPSRRDIVSRVDHLLRMVQLEGFAHRYPAQLSGGQRQRVALARALAIEPRVLLLDEPFGALDARVRKELRRWLRRLHDELGLTGIFVTHDQEEALEVADRVVVMNDGSIEQIGTPTEIHDHPATPFVYRFLGEVNSFRCAVSDRGIVLEDTLELNAEEPNAANGSVGTAFARPHEIEIAPKGATGAGLPARVRHTVILGPMVRVELERPGGTLIEAEVERSGFEALALGRGSEARLRVRRAEIFLDDGRRFPARATPWPRPMPVPPPSR